MNEIKLQVGVKILLKNREGKYLLLYRNLEKYTDVKHPWDLIGGRINPGVSLIENLKREVFEETQIELNLDPQLIAAQDIFPQGKHVVRLTYVGNLNREVNPVLSEEHTKFSWFNLEEMEELGEELDYFLKKLLNEGRIK